MLLSWATQIRQRCTKSEIEAPKFDIISPVQVSRHSSVKRLPHSVPRFYKRINVTGSFSKRQKKHRVKSFTPHFSRCPHLVSTVLSHLILVYPLVPVTETGVPTAPLKSVLCRFQPLMGSSMRTTDRQLQAPSLLNNVQVNHNRLAHAGLKA
jgi:hypothetical protein